MELLRKKRKSSFESLEGLVLVNRKPLSLSIIGGPHLSLEDRSKRKKKKKRVNDDDGDNDNDNTCKSRLTGIATAPLCSTSSSDIPGRGLKRKIGCIDATTRIGRRKKIDQEYILGDELGKGKFGSVRMCRSKANGLKFACKTLKKGEETVHREVEIMQHLSGHPGVVTLKAVYEAPECFHLVMELCSGGRLLDQMAKERRYSEHRAANMIKEVVLVIKYCHEMGVVHRDIKPENILLTASGAMKLADFGLAMRVSNGQSMSGVVGSPAYVAPEVLVGDYSEKVDIWSAGVLLHCLLIGVLPFRGDSLDAVFEAIKKVKLDFDSGIWESISAPARDLIKRMLTRDVSARISAEDVLRHPWILFYTERTLKKLNVKVKTRNLESERNRIASITLSDPISLSLDTSSQKSEEDQDDNCDLVDALATAIARVSLSEPPKRSKLCVPTTSPIRKDCSSNIKVNSLCTAF